MVELIYLFIILIFVVVFYKKDKVKLNMALVGFKKVSLSLTPYVLAIILISSIIEVCVPQDVILSLLGNEKPILAPILAALLGAVFEGPTVIAFVLGASLLVSGASISAVGAFISSFSMVGLIGLSLEKKELGMTFTMVRFIVTLIFSILIGYTMGVLI